MLTELLTGFIRLHFWRIVLMSKSHVPFAKESQASLTSTERTFNKLQAQIKALKEQQSKIQQGLDVSVQFYFGKVAPEEKALQEALSERVKMLYQVYKAPSELSSQEHELLKKFIIDDIDLLAKVDSDDGVSPEITMIWAELKGIRLDQLDEQMLASFNKKMQKKASEQESDEDDSDDNHRFSEEEGRQKESYTEFEEQAENAEQPKKSKKQLQKDAKNNSFKEMQKKNISIIYRRLARFLHPDLEQDSKVKAFKEDLIKKLIAAYKKNDLHGLLSVETEWVQYSSGQRQLLTIDQIEAYNVILRDQIKEVQVNTSGLLFTPEYSAVQPFYRSHSDGIVNLHSHYNILKKEAESVKAMLDNLQTADALAIIKNVIRQARSVK